MLACGCAGLRRAGDPGVGSSALSAKWRSVFLSIRTPMFIRHAVVHGSRRGSPSSASPVRASDAFPRASAPSCIKPEGTHKERSQKRIALSLEVCTTRTTALRRRRVHSDDRERELEAFWSTT